MATAWDEALRLTTEEGRQTAEAARALIHGLDPDVVEVVWPKQGTVGFGVGPKKMSEQYAYLAVHPKHVNLGFYRGGSAAGSRPAVGWPWQGDASHTAQRAAGCRAARDRRSPARGEG